MMYKLFIADDEELIVEGLCSAIPWRENGIEVCGTAYDGIEAERLIKELSPDIILTDIRMPGLSGLDLIGRIKTVLPDSKLIIISAYEDFEYAQRALREGALDYLIKPIDKQAVLDTVLRAKTLYEAEYDRKVAAQQMERYFDESAAHLLQHLLLLAIQGGGPDLEQTQACLIRNGVFQLYANYRVVWFGYGAEGSTGMDSMQRVLEGENDQNRCITGTLPSGEQIGLICSNLLPQELEAVTLKAVEKNERENQQKHIGVGKIVDSLTAVSDSYASIGEGAGQTIGQGPAHVAEEGQTPTAKTGINPLVERAREFILAHLHEDISLAHAAEHLSVNPAYLSRLFKQQNGCNFMDFLTARKIAVAKELLSTTTLFTYEIADRAGYQNSRYFSRVFKQATGLTPQQYRKQYFRADTYL